MNWRPINTAPRDSSSILIYCPKSERKPVCEAWWAIAYDGDTGGHWQTPIGPAGRGYTILPHAPTHWMPLPPPPEALAEQPAQGEAFGWCRKTDPAFALVVQRGEPDDRDREVCGDDLILLYTAPPAPKEVSRD